MNLFSCSYSENNFWPVSYFFRGSRPCGQPGQTAECKTALVLRYWLRSKRNFYKLASELPIGSFITKCTRVHTCETVNKSSKSSSYYIDSANLLPPAAPPCVGALRGCAFFRRYDKFFKDVPRYRGASFFVCPAAECRLWAFWKVEIFCFFYKAWCVLR